ncbi:MAG TPA: uracil-DNA glycosylase [Tepidisphaeraceae bacterium]|nr:uracil-DNA glycosylase [Tepidisphaeraceae bacterium]
MDELLKGRIRVWLRSERALGLSSLPVREAEMAAPMAAQPVPAPEPPVVVPHEARESQPPVAKASPPLPVELPVAPARDVEFAEPVLPREEKTRRLALINEQEVQGCTRCRLSQRRKHTVFGEGDVDAAICFIGEGPGENEDLTGRPFVGAAGQKLDEMIAAMGLRRDQVFIANVVKCRPPGNRAPAPDEVEACTGYLERQMEIIRPKVIVTLGLPATRYITQSMLSMGRLRGQWHHWHGIKVMPTYHPAYMLRNYTLETRKAVWSDLQKVMAELGLRPGKGKSQ